MDQDDFADTERWFAHTEDLDGRHRRFVDLHGSAHAHREQRVFVYDGNDLVHGDWSHEWDELYVHGDGHEWGGYWFGFFGFGSGCSGHGAGCSDECRGHGECECAVGGVVDGAIVERWQRDHRLHGDVVAGFVHVYDCNNLVHGEWSHEWHELHVHGDGHECCWYWFVIHCVYRDHPVDGSGCTDRCVRCVRQRAGRGVVDCSVFEWFDDHGLHGDLLARFVHLHDHHGHHLHGHWPHQWHELHVHGDGHECPGNRFGLIIVERCHAGHGAGRPDQCLRGLRQHAGHGLMVGSVLKRRDGHGLYGHIFAGFVDVYDCNNFVHGEWSHEWDELYVHGDGHEWGGYWFGFFGFGSGCSGHGAGCSDECRGHGECECAVGGVVDGAIVERWQRDHRLHGDVVAGFVHVYDCNNLVHGEWSHEWHELHVHGDGHECCWYWFVIHCVYRDHPVDGSGCTDRCVRCVRQRAGRGVVDCSVFEWFDDHGLHGDLLARFVHLHDHHGHHLHGHWPHQWHELHVHGDGHERPRHRLRLERFRCGDAGHRAGHTHECECGRR